MGLKDDVSNPFVNPIYLWQNYSKYWIEANRMLYENAVKANQLWFEALWAIDRKRKETTKVK
jgi:hypothetical protein